ncbi:DUF4344 domain-containing metallopeptidase [Conexibacter sp. CPCC 206217]|uniref:DUF4344 domain-containing metallopeptidase n=1 Tax=Conexibacter sp. CPCC 206217 TaxID=3064574 RepID=UPI0027241A53|nr:DUF4344 domain-containing metallopeptidase [Conexibacter sp. CPCC 206217]MDO8211141.1 DUF4344 domain-containing metallopeptidase [Conexibacter sp. CPCC 206217]
MRFRNLARALLLFAAVAALCSALAGSASAAPAKQAFTLEWGEFTPEHRDIAQTLQRSGAMDSLVRLVNRRYTTPRSIPIYFSDELDVGPAFLPEVTLKGQKKPVSFIHFPGSFLDIELTALEDELGRGAKNPTPREAMIFANEFVVAHEIGHALVNVLDIPITGREEDAVDGFATYLLTDSPDFGPRSAFSAALLFDALSRVQEPGESDFADEHSLPKQRVYQFLCWIYGSNTKRYRSLVGENGLTKARAPRCKDEWRQVNRSWSRLLAPYAR